MKGSGRDKYSIGSVLDYNLGDNFRVRNELMVSELTEKNSPYGSFSTYARQNPYERIYDENGDMVKTFTSTNEINPMINSTLPNRDRTKSTIWKDNFLWSGDSSMPSVLLHASAIQKRWLKTKPSFPQTRQHSKTKLM